MATNRSNPTFRRGRSPSRKPGPAGTVNIQFAEAENGDVIFRVANAAATTSRKRNSDFPAFRSVEADLLQLSASGAAGDERRGKLRKYLVSLEDAAAAIRTAIEEDAPASEKPVPLTREQVLTALIGDDRMQEGDDVSEIETAARADYFALRRRLLEGALTAPEVADLLGTSRQTPHDRVRGQSLLAVKEKGRWLFPPWQFDPTGPDGVVPGLPEVIRALDRVDPLSKINWFTLRNRYLKNRTPLEALRQSDLQRVLQTAQAVGVG